METRRRAQRAAYRDDHRCPGGPSGIDMDRPGWRRRSPLAGLPGMGSLDHGARLAVQPDLEHPARQEGRAVGGNLAGPGAARWAWAATGLQFSDGSLASIPFPEPN